MKTKLVTPRNASAALALAFLSAAFPLQAGQGPKPSICSRACWGARSPQCSISQMSSLTRAIIHHTGGAGEYSSNLETSKAKCRSNQSYVMDTLGYCDADYHFYVDAGGHIFEGRQGSLSNLPRGSHDACNDRSFGYACLGYFHSPYNQSFTSDMRSALEAVIAWRMPSSWSATGSGTYCGKSVGTLDGHYKVTATACPGDRIIPSIPGLRTHVMNRKNGVVLKDRVHVFGRGGDGACYNLSWWEGDGWQDWYSLGGSIVGGVDAWARNPDHVAVVVRSATDVGHIKKKSWTSATGWDAWEDLWTPVGGNMTSDPAACARGSSAAHIFARGGDGACWKRSWSATTGWAEWDSLGGSMVGAPDCASKDANHVVVVVRSATEPGHIKKRTWTTDSGWETYWEDIWTSVGGNMDSDPSCVSRGGTKIHVFARKGNAIWVRSHTEGSGWAEWYSIGAPSGKTIVEAPDSYSRGEDHVAVVVRDSTSNCWKKTWTTTGSWDAWESLGQPTGGLTSSPGSVAR